MFVPKKSKLQGPSKIQPDKVAGYVKSYCGKNSVEKLPNICPPSLPAVLKCPETSKKQGGMFAIGFYDDPNSQAKAPALIGIDGKNILIIGSSRFGKTNFPQGLIRAIPASFTLKEASICILDFGSMAMKNFEGLRHVGGAVSSQEGEKLKSLFKLPFGEMET